MQVFALEDDIDHITVAIFATKEEAVKVASQLACYKIRSFLEIADYIEQNL